MIYLFAARIRASVSTQGEMMSAKSKTEDSRERVEPFSQLLNGAVRIMFNDFANLPGVGVRVTVTSVVDRGVVCKVSCTCEEDADLEYDTQQALSMCSMCSST